MPPNATISTEVAAKLAAQKRNSTLSSITVTLIGYALLGLILWIISFTHISKNNEDLFAYSSISNQDPEVKKR